MAFKMNGWSAFTKDKKSNWNTPGHWKYNLKQTFSDIKGKFTGERYYK